MNFQSFLERYIRPYFPGRSFYCPCCETTSAHFLSFGLVPRPNAMCPHCRSLERHRLLWLYLERKTDFFRKNMTVLDVAPQEFLQTKFRAMRNHRYLSIDLSSDIAMQRMDLTDLQIPDNTYDCVFCSHVLEHVPDDAKAMRELYRVMKPGAWAIVQCPVDETRPTTYEDWSITDPHERIQHFGQHDHVRKYGRDFTTRLEQAGFMVEKNAYASELPTGMVRRCALINKNILYVCRKPAASVTVVLTNWKRAKNLRLIIDHLRRQTTRPVLFLWNNQPPFRHPGIDWQIDSSTNRFCWPRWLMASFAATEFVAVMDDDLIFTDAHVLEDAAAMLRTQPEATAIGLTGVRLDPEKEYREGAYIASSPDRDQSVDIVKGRFMMIRTAALRKLSLQPSPTPETLIADDILVSGALADGKKGVHVVPSLFAGRWRELPADHALWKMPGHFDCRERARRLAFADD